MGLQKRRRWCELGRPGRQRTYSPERCKRKGHVSPGVSGRTCWHFFDVAPLLLRNRRVVHSALYSIMLSRNKYTAYEVVGVFMDNVVSSMHFE